VAVPLLLLCALSACGGGQRATTGSAPHYGYAPPGPPEDPWGPYIHEASARFSVPERWIRAVMHQESGGHEYLNGQPTTSDAGATGLMQVMPATYAELQSRYNLGSDPYNPHDNILAGTAYIREMYDKYGSPAFLAAYDAGPHRVDDYMAGRSGLPNETVNYVAAIAPHLGNDLPMSGPLVAYASNGGTPLTPDPVPQAYASAPIAGCWRDPDAAYDPDAPCRAAPPPAQISSSYRAPVPPPVQVAAAPARAFANCWHDPNAAYDPTAPCQAPPESAPQPAAPVQVAEAAPMPGPTEPGHLLWGSGAIATPPAQPTRPAPQHHSFASYLIPQAAAAELPPPRNSGAWSIQVGAFANADLARDVAAAARAKAPRELAGARTVLGTTAPFGGHVLYRARLAGLSAQSAARACSTLSALRQACLTVPPGG